MTGPLLLGIDGGGSKTIAALADRGGEVVALASGQGVNPIDNPHWLGNYAATLDPLLSSHRCVAFGIAALPAYGEIEQVGQAQEAATAERLGVIPFRVINDVEAAHFGAFGGGAGVLILAGTGSMAWASDGHGRNIRVGGWGDAFGDEGSAYWIGLEAVRMASHAVDGRIDAKPYADAFFHQLGLDPADQLDALTGWFSGLGHSRSEVAALAPWIDEMADAGNLVALSLIERAADHLALHVKAAARQIGAGSEPAWSFAGGAFGSRRLLATLTRKIGRAALPPKLPPIGGLLRAARDLDWPVDQAWIERLAASIAQKCRSPETATPSKQGTE
jgi:glucosamine kinase